MRSEGRTVATVVIGMMLWQVCAAQDVCYTAGGVAGIVIATIIVTLILGGLTAAVVRYLWTQRTASHKGGEKMTLPETCLPEKQLIGPKADYAFDNPYFKDDDGGNQGSACTPDAAEKGEAGFASDRGDNDNSQNSKINSGSKLKKHKPFTNNPFYSVFSQGYKKPKSMDDTYVSKQCERISVPLRGHDFTGLGFNICGNMRDGIFVKDVLHRGPASESGKIKSGDRIISVTVSFGSIVYEDALTILSYASPYDVKLEIEEGGEKNVLLATSSPGKRLASASFRNGGKRLFHPLYRSQSIDDLTQIGKDSFLLQTKSSGSASSYKRSQSIQATTPKSLPVLKPSESAPDTKAFNSSKRSMDSTGSSESSMSKKVSTETLESSSCEELSEKNDSLGGAKNDQENDSFMKYVNISLDSGGTAECNDSEAVIIDTATLELPVQERFQKREVNDSHEMPKHIMEIASIQQQDLEVSLIEMKMPKAPPRKQNTPGKRKAPSPPKLQQLNSTATEISAVVHQVDEAADSQLRVNPTISGKLTTGLINHCVVDTSDKNGEKLSDIYDDKDLEKSENSTYTSGGSLYSNEEISEPSSPKRKASSLGDLTKLNESGSKKVSSTILERAVSLDLQQQQTVPEGNLERQKKILKPPVFNPEDTSEEDFHCVADQEMPANDWGIVDQWRKLSVSPVDNSDSDMVLEDLASRNLKSVSVFSPAKKSLYSNSSIANGHHPTSEELSSKLDDSSADFLKVKEDISVSTSISASHNESEYKNITSTPAHKIVEFDSFLEASSPIEGLKRGKEEENEYNSDKKTKSSTGGSENNSTDTACSSSFSRSTHPLSIPVSLSIPIIPPVIHHYEKLSISPSSNIQGQKDSLDEHRQDSEETPIPSLYKPIFITKQLKATNTTLTMSLSPDSEPLVKTNTDETQESCSSKEKDSTLTPSTSVNGDEADLSSIGQYRTAVEFPTTTDSTVFVTSKVCSTSSSLNSLPTGVANEYSSTDASESSVHGRDFSYAKKGIASSPTEEN